MHYLLKSSIYSSIVLLLVVSCKENNELLPTTPAPKKESSLNYDMPENALSDAGWKREFADEFSNNDFSQWDIWKGGAYNDEYQYYSNNLSNLSITNGNLIITAKKEFINGLVTPYTTAKKDFQFTSARIESKKYYTPNANAKKVRISARIKLPAGFGMWPAFWLYGNNWPTNGEIDILEAKGQDTSKFATNIFYGTKIGIDEVNGREAKEINTGKNLQLYWHVYEVIWENNKLTFLFDGQIIDVKDRSIISALNGKLQKITLNVAVGGNYFGPTPLQISSINTGSMYVDWVRVHSSNN